MELQKGDRVLYYQGRHDKLLCKRGVVEGPSTRDPRLVWVRFAFGRYECNPVNLKKERYCYLCYFNQSDHALCQSCLRDLELLGATPPPAEATKEEVKEWANKYKVTVHSCTEEDMLP